MIRSSNGNIFRVTGHLCGEFTAPGEFLAQRPVTRSFHIFCDLRLNKRLGKQSWGWWFETLSHPLWRHRNVLSTEQKSQCLAWDTFKSIYFDAKVCVATPLEFIPKGSIGNEPLLFQVMAWCHHATSHYLSQCMLSKSYVTVLHH